ncbi:MAG: flagellar biosynthesis protein FliQ [Firmicutes bacterium]|nr:flagellar biosynthesis protein FliQ [Bacillota bacterium]
MSQDAVLDIFREAIITIIYAASPMLLVALGIGLLVAVFQATTQIQEQTLAFVPKVLGVFIVLILLGPWILGRILGFTEKIFLSMNTLL